MMLIRIFALSCCVLVTTLSPAQAPIMRVVWSVDPNWQEGYALEWLAERPWAWGVEADSTSPLEGWLAARDQGLMVTTHVWANARTIGSEYGYSQRHFLPYSEAVGKLRQVHGDKAIVFSWLEDDSAGVAFPQELLAEDPTTHEAAFDLFEAYLDRSGQRIAASAPHENWAVLGYSTTAHAIARRGADMVLIERTNDDVEDLKTAIAFARGAANQYGTEWGIDLSLWWGTIYGVVHTMPGSLYKRHLYESWFAGARGYRIEGGNILLSQRPESLLARELDQALTELHNIGPGTPDVPVAILLPQDHGWMTPMYYRTNNTAWNYARIPYRQGQRAIDGFFLTAFPGIQYVMDPWPWGAYELDDPPPSPFALSAIVPRFAPDPEDVFFSEPPVPFGTYENRHEARQQFAEQGKDSAPFRAMGDTRWGQCFDVLMAEGPLDALDGYKMVLLLGQIELNDALAQRLTTVAERGGVVMLAAGAAKPEHTELTGLIMTPELRTSRSHQFGGEGEWRPEALRYVPAEIAEGADAEVLARDRGGHALAVSNRKGEGNVITSLVPWFEGPQGRLAGPVKRILDGALADLLPLQWDGPPAAWQSSTRGDARIIVVSNNDGVDASGTMTIGRGAYGRAQDMVTGEALTIAEGKLELSIAPYDVRAILLSP